MPKPWPLMACLVDFAGGPPGLPGGNSVDLLGPATPVALRGFSTARGRQYELGTVQAGTMSMDLTDPNEYLNPVNTGSPWNSGGNQLLPYRRVQVCALWNPATRDQTGNILNSTNFPVASFTVRFDPSFESSIGGWFALAGAPGVSLSPAQHFAGAQSMAVNYTSAADKMALSIFQFPGRQHTVSLYVFVPAGHTATLRWEDLGFGGTTLGTATSSTTGAWQRLTITATPSAWTSALTLTCSAAYPATVYVDAYQLDLGGAASPFTTAGPTLFEIFTGYVERFPQRWEDQGMRGIKPLEAVDALSPLSRTIISQSYSDTVLADGPSVFVPYDDDSFPQTVQRPTGGQPMIPYQVLGSQSASVSFGGDAFLDGSKAVVLSQQNSDPLTSGDNTQTTRLGTRYGGLTMNPQSFTLEAWVKLSAGQMWFGAGAVPFGESTTNPALHDGPTAKFSIRTFQNRVAIWYTDPNGVDQLNVFFNQPLYFADGKWHHIVVECIGGNQAKAYRDGAQGTLVATLNFVSTPPVMEINNIYHIVNTFYGDIISTASFANLALYTSPLTVAQLTAHYQRGIGNLGEKSGTRALRLLTQYWSTNVVTDTGKTSMAADFSYNGRSMLDVLQEIADTEAGLVWVDAAGLVHQDSRETRYTVPTSTTAQFVFGERPDLGELPYTDLEYDYDPTYVYSQANFTAGGSGKQLPPVVNATTQAAVGQRILSKTLQMANDWDVQQAAQFYVSRYAKPAGAPGTGVPPRIAGMTIDPSSNPDLWTAALTLDNGYRVTVKRRTAAGVTVSGDYYIEQVNHANNGKKWTVHYELSPVFVPQAWVLGDATKGVLGTTSVCVY
jgi:hypothetical protein